MAKTKEGYGQERRLTFNDTHKMCTKCNTMKEHIQFSKDKRGVLGLCYYCKACANSKGKEVHQRRMKEDPEYVRNMKDKHKRQTWGISLDEYNLRMVTQKVCAICSTELLGGVQTHLDHNHKTGKLREFLCTNCNRGIGHLQESEELLMNAIKYLQKHSNNVDVIKEGRLHETPN